MSSWLSVAKLPTPPATLLLCHHGTPGAAAAEALAYGIAVPGATTLVHCLVVPELWAGMQGDDWLNNASIVLVAFIIFSNSFCFFIGAIGIYWYLYRTDIIEKYITGKLAAICFAIILLAMFGDAILPFTEGKNWPGWSPTWMLGHRIGGKRLGIIGMGRIGQAVARRARAFGLQIHYHNRKPVSPRIAEELEATYWESLDQMLARMDIISVNCPHTPATYHLLSARRLKLMQPHAILVNTARGEIIDESALADLLAARGIAGAGLDVFEFEPQVNPKLLGLPNAVLLPHLGSATVEARTEMGEKVIINIRTWMDGHRPPDRVLPSML